MNEADRKRALRSAARTARANADPVARADGGAGWSEGVLGLEALTGARTVAVYVSYGTEPPTTDLIDALVGRGVRVLVPILLADHDLDWADHARSTQALGREGIRSADVVVIPALMVGTDGARLGQGGGSYDRALARVRAGTPLVALVHDDEFVDAGVVPTEPHDRAVTHVVTPTRVVELDADLEDAGDLPLDPDVAFDPDDEFTIGWLRQRDLDVALAVAIGGALGSAARWGLNQALPHTGGAFPWSTFVENVSGAFVLGALVVLLIERWHAHRHARYLRPFLVVGVLGGFTTFSTYVADIRGLTADDHAATALLYLVLTLAVGLLACLFGVLSGRALAGRTRATSEPADAGGTA